jgi:hypothetical protein
MHAARFETVRRAQADRWVHDVAGAAIASDIGVHCYLQFVRGASPLFLHDKFSRALQIFIVLYNEPSLNCTPSVRQGKGGAEYLRFGQNEFEFANGNKGPSPP